jgi:hypothetical protein
MGDGDGSVGGLNRDAWRRPGKTCVTHKNCRFQNSTADVDRLMDRLRLSANSQKHTDIVIEYIIFWQ